MPKVYVKKPRPYTEEDIKKALELIEKGILTYRAASEKFKIDKSVLTRRRAYTVTTQGRKTSLSQEAEKDLSEKIKIMAKWGFALTKNEILQTVQTYCIENDIRTTFKNGKPGNDWFRAFCKRHRLSQKKLEQLEKSRRTATSDPFIIYGFYEKLEATIHQLHLEDCPGQIWNLDETSFSSDPNRVKGVAEIGQKVHRNIEGSGKENTTVMACISAAGVLLPPLIIFQGAHLWTSWKGTKDLPNTVYACSEKGWMTTNIFQEWFQKFCTLIKNRPQIVIMDGHVTHLDKSTIELAIRENITLLKLPAHTTDVLQPLDKCCFGPLKLKWNNALIEWQRLNQRKLSKSEFCDLLCEIWDEGISQQVIKSAFASTGIYPCNKDKYPVHRLDPEKMQRYQNPEPNAENPTNVFVDEQVEPEVLPSAEANKTPLAVAGPSMEINDLSPLTSPTPSCSTHNTTNSNTSLSFESLLLSKIKRTAPSTQKRKKIDGTVLTSKEFLSEIEKKDMKNEKKCEKKNKKKPKKTRKPSESNSEDYEEVKLDDESDVENLTLEDIVSNEENWWDFENNEANEPLGPMKQGDYILVRFATKCKNVFYVAQIEEVGEEDVDVKYLRRNGNKFLEPVIAEKYSVPKTDIECQLPAPTVQGGTERTAKQFLFTIDFNKYNVK